MSFLALFAYRDGPARSRATRLLGTRQQSMIAFAGRSIITYRAGFVKQKAEKIENLSGYFAFLKQGLANFIHETIYIV